MIPHVPNDDGCDGLPDRPKRRNRYAGTHPRRFVQRYKELNPDSYPEIHEHVRAQGRTPAGTHVPVLLGETLAALQPKVGDVVVDCTIGYGGHAAEMLRHVQPTGRLIGLDVDAAELRPTSKRLGATLSADKSQPCTPGPGGICLHRCHFGGIGKVLAREGLDGCDVILADLGASSMQLDDPARGFSYKYDGPLDMRMDDRLPHTAADLLAELSEEKLAANLLALADEPDYERIARAIAQRRIIEPITHSRQLVRLIHAAKGLPRRVSGRRDDAPADRRHPDTGERYPTTGKRPPATSERHPAARTFQALRMMVNDEMGGLEQLLRVAPYCLRPGGRIGIISFHSGEHQRVQRAFCEGLHTRVYAAISEEPIQPTPQEIAANPRSRSARLRWAIKSPG